MQHLAVASFNNGSGKETNSLSYSDLANTAEETETLHFLTGEMQPQSDGGEASDPGTLKQCLYQ